MLPALRRRESRGDDEKSKLVFDFGHLVLHGLPAALYVAVGQDDALLIHTCLLLHVGLHHSHFQAAAKHDGGVACVHKTFFSVQKLEETVYASQTVERK